MIKKFNDCVVLSITDHKHKVSTNAQTDLWSALSSNNFEKFQRKLTTTDVSNRVDCLESYDAESGMSIFELACKTPERRQFIEQCVLTGCDPNKVTNPIFRFRFIFFQNIFVSAQSEIRKEANYIRS